MFKCTFLYWSCACWRRSLRVLESSNSCSHLDITTIFIYVTTSTVAFTWQTLVDKLKMICVNETTTVGKLVETNRIFYLANFFSNASVFGMIGKGVSFTFNQSKLCICSRDLSEHCTKWRTIEKPLLNCLTCVWFVKAGVCQLFVVCPIFSLSCEGHLRHLASSNNGPQSLLVWSIYAEKWTSK